MNGRLRTGIVISLLAAILINFITGCTLIALSVLADSPPPLAGTYQYPAAGNISFRKLIVIGLTSNNADRTALENAFMDQFLTEGVNIAGCNISLPPGQGLPEKEIVEKTIRNGSYDGAIVVETINVREADVAKWLPAWKAGCRSDRSEFMARTAGAGQAKGPVSDRVRLEIALWDMKKSVKVWSGTSGAIDKYDLAVESYTAARSTAAALRKTRLLQNN